MADPQAQANVPSTVPMFDPNGILRDVPQDQLLTAVHNGGMPAVKFRPPNSSDPNDIRYVPANRTHEAVQNGGTVVPLEAQDAPGIWGMLAAHPLASLGQAASTLWGDIKSIPSAITGPDPLADPRVPDAEKNRIVAQQEAQAAATNKARETTPGLPAWYPGKAYSWLASAGEYGGVPVSGMEQSGAQGDPAGVLGHAAFVPATMAAGEGIRQLSEMPTSKLTAPVRAVTRGVNKGLEKAPGSIGGAVGATIGHKIGGPIGAEIGGAAGYAAGRELLPKVRVPGEGFGLPNRVTGGPEVAPQYQAPAAPLPTPPPVAPAPAPTAPTPAPIVPSWTGAGQPPAEVPIPIQAAPPETAAPAETAPRELLRKGPLPERFQPITPEPQTPAKPTSKAELGRQLDQALPESMGYESTLPKPGQPIATRPQTAAETPAAAPPAKLPDLTPVESSAVEGYHYDPERQEFYYKEKSNGVTYVYGDIDPETANTFAQAESKGKALAGVRNQPGSTLVAKIINGERVAVKPSARSAAPTPEEAGQWASHEMNPPKHS